MAVCLRLVPKQLGDHVDEDEDPGEEDDAGVEGHVHRAPGDGRHRQGHEVLLLLLPEEVPDARPAEGRGQEGAGRLLAPSPWACR